MKKQGRMLLVMLLALTVLLGSTFSVSAAGGFVSPATGERPSATPYILGGVMLLCVAVIVVLFWPKKKRPQAPTEPPSESDEE